MTTNGGPTRTVTRWLNSLELSYLNREIERKTSNGILVAVILHTYYPRSVNLGYLVDGSSTSIKASNWRILEKVFKSLEFPIEQSIIDGTIHGKYGAAFELITKIYEFVTGKEAPRICWDYSACGSYHRQRRWYARDTAITLINRNIRTSEMILQPDIIVRRKWMQNILDQYRGHRENERMVYPRRCMLKRPLFAICERK
ncbi:hypothetical protein CRM22_006834 [Opisthorchis felineus]|uniref:CH-like domain-containing protein n=1 Tax=Opisthorchis felineus TaxID=147828 RepID=A0A4V6RGX5_OPIFE|nr:hypothetical protein CRM22_006834 [Opisthorchis felineus]